MNREEQTELVADYLDSEMLVLRGSGLLAAIAFGGRDLLSGGPTNRLRDELLASLDRFDVIRAKLVDRVYPPLHSAVPAAVESLRAALLPWTPPEISEELGQAAVALAAALAKSMFASPAPPPPSDPREPGVDELGLPLPRRGMRTFYNASARVLLVTVQQMQQPGQIVGDRLFVRRVDEPLYSEVILPGARLAPKDVVVCAEAPVAFVQALLVSGDGEGADDGGIFCIELPDGTPRMAVPGRAGGGWISDLLGASPDGAVLHVICASMSAWRADSCRAGYCLASIDIATGDFTEIAPVPGVFA